MLKHLSSVWIEHSMLFCLFLHAQDLLSAIKNTKKLRERGDPIPHEHTHIEG